VILDSDVLIEVLRGNAQTARWVAAERDFDTHP